MLKEVLIAEAVSRHLTGEKILAICEANGEFCTLSDILVGFRFLIDDVPPAVEEAPEEEEDEEEAEEDTATDAEEAEEELPPCPLDNEEYV